MIKPIVTPISAAIVALIMMQSNASASAVGYVAKYLTVRAGPGIFYPAVTLFPAGTQVLVIGCTDGFDWCDVSTRGIRGWVSGSDLEVAHRNVRMRADEIGPQIGLPITSFELGSYWDRHYRGFSWHNERSRYGGRQGRLDPPEEGKFTHPERQDAPARVAPRHVGPQENRLGDSRFLPTN